jgi:DNA primase
MKFSTTFLDDIRSRVSISSVVGRKVAWDRRKSNPGKGDYWACCPFHGEKSPSFHVDDRKGRYHCFGCKVSGDIFTFLVEKEGLNFPEAVEQLALEAGMEVPKNSAEKVVKEKKRASLYDVMNLAVDFFHVQLFTKQGEEALKYLQRRGIREDTIREFRIGYGPNSRNALRSFLTDKGVELEQMIAAGLVVSGDDIPVAYDRFRDRVMFPIEDMKGRPIAFGGRALDPNAPAKYLNSPETELFDKSSTLFNISRARKPAFEKSEIVVVEGYMDVVASYQEGFTNLVAALGTALTENHLKQLWKFSPDPILCFDGDKAGYQAASRALDRALPLLASGYSLKFTFLPDQKDPADLMIEGRQKDFAQFLKESLNSFEYFWRRETEVAEIGTPEKKAGLEAKINAAVRTIQDENVRKYYSIGIRMRLSDLFWTYDRTKKNKNKQNSVITMPPDEATESLVLGFAVHIPKLLVDHLEEFLAWHFHVPAHIAFQRELGRLLVEFKELSVASIYKNLDEKFYMVFEQIYGSEKTKGKIKLPWGHRLFARFPVVKYDPSYDFISRYFLFLAKKLVLNSMVIERDEAFRMAEMDLNEKNERILLNLIREIEIWRNETTLEENELYEEIKIISEAYWENVRNNYKFQGAPRKYA